MLLTSRLVNLIQALFHARIPLKLLIALGRCTPPNTIVASSRCFYGGVARLHLVELSLAFTHGSIDGIIGLSATEW